MRMNIIKLPYTVYYTHKSDYQNMVDASI